MVCTSTHSKFLLLLCDSQCTDAPVSGGPGGAWNGTLSVMLGGGKEEIEVCRPLLELYCANIKHMGGIG